jgi:hypothetical protein
MPQVTPSRRQLAGLAALGALRHAAYDLLKVWGSGTAEDQPMEAVLGAGYPPCLPSFDEFVCDLDRWMESAEAAARGKEYKAVGPGYGRLLRGLVEAHGEVAAAECGEDKHAIERAHAKLDALVEKATAAVGAPRKAKKE